MLIRILAVACATFLLSACNPAEKLRDPAAQSVLETTVDKLQRRDPAAVDTFSPQIRPQLTPAVIDQFAEQMPPGKQTARKTVSTHITTSGAGSAVTTLDEYSYGDRTVIVHARLVRAAEGEPWQVSDFHIQPVTAAHIAAQRFFAPGKTAKHYLFLLAAVLSPLLMIAALVKVIRTKGLKRKWLWGVLAFVGLLQFQMNWTTGAIGWGLSIQFIGAGIMKAGVSTAPWFLSVTIPVGALLILTGVLANPARARTKAPNPTRTEAPT